MIELSDKQRRDLDSGKAVEIIDSQTDQQYVLLPKVAYEKLCRLLFDDSEWTAAEMRLSLGRSAKDNGWDEADMDDYDRYDEVRQKRCP